MSLPKSLNSHSVLEDWTTLPSKGPSRGSGMLTYGPWFTASDLEIDRELHYSQEFCAAFLATGGRYFFHFCESVRHDKPVETTKIKTKKGKERQSRRVECNTEPGMDGVSERESLSSGWAPLDLCLLTIFQKRTDGGKGRYPVLILVSD